MPRWRVPLDWAKTQSSLGGALAVLGWREKNLIYLQEAVDGCRQVLNVLEDIKTADVLPLVETAQQNLELAEDYRAQLGTKQ